MLSHSGVFASEGTRTRESTIEVDHDVAYALTYPAQWHRSTVAYANAFEIRNHTPTQLASVPERNRASVIVIYTKNETADATRQYFNRLEGQLFDLSGRPAKRQRRRVSPEALGPGTRAPSDMDGARSAPDHWVISTHVANGKVLLAIEGSVPVTADAKVVDEIVEIEDSLRFVNSKKEEVP